MTKVRRRIKGISSLILAQILLILALLCPVTEIEANANGLGGMQADLVDRFLNLPRPIIPLSMKTARALALHESTDYFKVEQEIMTQKANLESSLKKIKMKQKNMSTLRWSPLLNFKFPTKPTEQESHDFQFKPISIQAEIDKSEHKLIDTKLGIYEDVSTLYVDIVFLQRKIEFEEQRIKAYEEGVKKNQARLLTGDATQADIDAIQAKLDNEKSSLAADERQLASNLDKLSTKLGTDVTTGYSFENPFLEASVPREYLDALIEYTLAHDQQYYELCLDDTTARISLTINYNLMSKKYGGDINMISSYVEQALAGVEIKGSLANAFTTDYKEFIKTIDSYWEGKKKILFIKVPKLWFKGAMDGTRYIEDDPDVLKEDVLAYSEAHTEKLKREQELTQEVKDTFENYISTRNAYRNCIKDLDKAKEQLDKAFILNQIGELSFEEYDSESSDYEELQNTFLDLMKSYTNTIYSFDRLTCGAITAFLDGSDANLAAGESGTSHVEKEITEGAKYYIKQIVQEQGFELSIYIPDDFPVNISHFELICDGQKIGGKTEVDKAIKHLAVTKTQVKEAKIRLYDEEEFIDDVVIDPADSSGPLPVVTDRKIVKTSPDEIGLYTVTTNTAIGIMTLSVDITEDPDAKYYQVMTKSGNKLSSEPIKVGESFKHLSLVEDGLDELEISVMSESKDELYKARFITSTRKVKKKTED